MSKKDEYIQMVQAQLDEQKQKLAELTAKATGMISGGRDAAEGKLAESKQAVQQELEKIEATIAATKDKLNELKSAGEEKFLELKTKIDDNRNQLVAQIKSLLP